MQYVFPERDFCNIKIKRPVHFKYFVYMEGSFGTLEVYVCMEHRQIHGFSFTVVAILILLHTSA